MKNDTEWLTASMKLAGGLFSLLAVIISIINARYQRAKKLAQKEQIVANVFLVSQLILLVIAVVLFNTIRLSPSTIAFVLLPCIIAWMDFLRRPIPASRIEVLNVVAYSCFFVFLTSAWASSRILDVLEKNSRTTGEVVGQIGNNTTNIGMLTHLLAQTVNEITTNSQRTRELWVTVSNVVQSLPKK